MCLGWCLQSVSLLSLLGKQRGCLGLPGLTHVTGPLSLETNDQLGKAIGTIGGLILKPAPHPDGSGVPMSMNVGSKGKSGLMSGHLWNRHWEENQRYNWVPWHWVSCGVHFLLSCMFEILRDRMDWWPLDVTLFSKSSVMLSTCSLKSWYFRRPVHVAKYLQHRL